MLRVQQHVARRLVRPCARKVPRRWSSDDVQMLERLLKEAKEREKVRVAAGFVWGGVRAQLNERSAGFCFWSSR